MCDKETSMEGMPSTLSLTGARSSSQNLASRSVSRDYTASQYALNDSFQSTYNAASTMSVHNSSEQDNVNVSIVEETAFASRNASVYETDGDESHNLNVVVPQPKAERLAKQLSVPMIQLNPNQQGTPRRASVRPNLAATSQGLTADSNPVFGASSHQSLIIDEALEYSECDLSGDADFEDTREFAAENGMTALGSRRVSFREKPKMVDASVGTDLVSYWIQIIVVIMDF
jgi:hypothetical protein